MNDNQKSLNTIKKTIYDLAPKGRKNVFALRYEIDAMQSLVDRDILMKPQITVIDKEYGSYHCDCPKCGYFLSVNCKDVETKFCSECGQAIDWSE